MGTAGIAGSRLDLRSIYARLLATLAMVSVALAGCTTGDDDAAPTTETIAQVVTAIAPSGASRDTEANPSAGAAGIVAHVVTGELLLDPLAQSPLNHFPFGEVYSGLVSIVSEGGGTIEPELAATWQASEDGLRYTFNLREGLRFSDGSPLTARDVVWSWERALSAGYATELAPAVFGAIVGAQEMLELKARELSGVRAVDDLTLEVSLVRPQSHFVASLSHPVASVLSQFNVEGWGTLNWVRMAEAQRDGYQDGDLEFDVLPAGTGPFRITRERDQELVELEPNPFYFRGPSPSIDTRVFVFNGLNPPPEIHPQRLDFYQWDVIPTSEEITTSYAQGPPVLDTGEELDYFSPYVGTGTPVVSYLALNSAVAPLDDVAFRRGLLLAANRSAAVDIALEGAPEELARGLIPPDFPGHRAELPSIDFDLVAAEARLAASTYAVDDPAAQLAIFDDESGLYPGFYSDLARPWAENLGVRIDDRTVGGSLRRSAADGAPSLPDIPLTLSTAEYHRRLANGGLHTRYVNVIPSYPDPCAILCRVPDLFGPNAQSDETRELRAMLDEAAATSDPVARIAKYQDIEAHILDRALVIPIVWRDSGAYRLVKNFISGYKEPIYGGSMYEDVVVDTTHPDYPPQRLSGGGG